MFCAIYLFPTLKLTNLSKKKKNPQEFHAYQHFNTWLFIISLHLILMSEICIHYSGIIYINCKLLYKYKLSPPLLIIIIIIIIHNNLSFSLQDLPVNHHFLIYTQSGTALLDPHCPMPEYHNLLWTFFPNSLIS